MGELAVLIIKFDNVFANGQIHRLWSNYMKLIRLIERNLDKLDTQAFTQNHEEYTEDDVQGLENILQKLEFLFTGELFQVNNVFFFSQLAN